MTRLTKRGPTKKVAVKKVAVKKVAAKKTATPKVIPLKASEKKQNTKEICFTIMPFGGWFDSYYEDIYCPAIQSCNMEPRRADDLYRPSNIVQDIWSLTKRAKIVLADLTNKNANVFYELGLAHSLAKPAILITQSLDDVPFDLRSLRVIEYDKNSPNWGQILQENIAKAINETLKSPTETIPTAFLEVQETHAKQTTKLSRHDKEILELKNDVDMLRRQLSRSPQVAHRTGPTISEVEAEREVFEMIRQGYPLRIIRRKLMDKFNIPIEYTMKIYDDLIRRNLINPGDIK